MLCETRVARLLLPCDTTNVWKKSWRRPLTTPGRTIICRTVLYMKRCYSVPKWKGSKATNHDTVEHHIHYLQVPALAKQITIKYFQLMSIRVYLHSHHCMSVRNWMRRWAGPIVLGSVQGSGYHAWASRSSASIVIWRQPCNEVGQECDFANNSHLSVSNGWPTVRSVKMYALEVWTPVPFPPPKSLCRNVESKKNSRNCSKLHSNHGTAVIIERHMVLLYSLYQ